MSLETGFILLGVIGFVVFGILPWFRRPNAAESLQERRFQNHTLPDPGRLRPHWLVAVGGMLEGRTWWLGERIVTVGRTPDNLVQVNEEAVSRTHCRIEPSGAGPVLVDLGSVNGTSINGKKTDRVTLLDGDILQIGNQAFRYEAIGNYVQDAAIEWKAAGEGVRKNTQIGASPQLRESIEQSLKKHDGDVMAVTQELQIPAEMVERYQDEDNAV